MAQTILYLLIVFIVFEFLLSKTLSWLNMKTWDAPLPDEVKTLYDADKYTQAREYAKANNKVSTITATVSLFVSVSFLWVGGFCPTR